MCELVLFEKFQNNWVASKILSTHFKALLILYTPSPMSICIIIQQWVLCFMHERKNVWAICPADQSTTLLRPFRFSHSLSRLHTVTEREQNSINPKRVEIIREIGRSLKKRPVPDFTFRGIRFACKSIWIRIRAHSHDYIGANLYCPPRDFQAWKVAVLRETEKDIHIYTIQNFSIYSNSNCKTLEDIVLK